MPIGDVLGNNSDEIIAKISNLEHGHEFCLRTLFDDAWADVASKNALGRQFRDWVAAGQIPGVVELREAPNHTIWYQKIE